MADGAPSLPPSSSVSSWIDQLNAWRHDERLARLARENAERIMTLVRWLVTHTAPLFLVTSPVTSYADQIWNIHKKRSSAGFSLDIPLIMLASSTLKIFFWFGDHYDVALLIQAVVMIFVQTMLLHVALLHRPSYTNAQPFTGIHHSASRPYGFWQWRSARPYWQSLGYYALALAVLQLVLGGSTTYIAAQGLIALGTEALLPIPQILENRRSQSCKGFRLSVLANWLIGDLFKMTYFFLSDSSVPLAFKLCGLFQASCDVYLGIQYYMYGDGGGLLDGDEAYKLARLA